MWPHGQSGMVIGLFVNWNDLLS